MSELEEPGFDLLPIHRGGAGPEVLFEQVKLPLLLTRQGANLIHAPNCFLPLVRRCPGVVTVHDLAFHHWPRDFGRVTGAKYRLLARAAARSADRIICPSDFTAGEVSDRYKVPPDRIRVIAEAPALPLGSHPTPSGPYVAAIGDLRAKKNLAALVSAFSKLSRAGEVPHRLVLVGLDTGAGPALRQRAGSAPVEFTGYLADAELDALLRGADLLVNPSLHEGFGLVLLEAMVRGTPVLAARATALPQTGGDAAAYFSPGDDESLTTELQALLLDPLRRTVMSELGRAHAARYSWKRAAELTADVYRELL